MTSFSTADLGSEQGIKTVWTGVFNVKIKKAVAMSMKKQNIC